jgi:hypothetical protein
MQTNNAEQGRQMTVQSAGFCHESRNNVGLVMQMVSTYTCLHRNVMTKHVF